MNFINVSDENLYHNSDFFLIIASVNLTILTSELHNINSQL